MIYSKTILERKFTQKVIPFFWYILVMFLLIFHFYYTYRSCQAIIFYYRLETSAIRKIISLFFNFLFLLIEFIATLNGLELIYFLGSSINYHSPKDLTNEVLSQPILPFVAVVITSYKEPFELLSKTIEGALKMDYPPDRYGIYVLDDSPPEMTQELDKYCQKLHIPILRRSTRKGFKAGALNNALFSIESDFFAILDADHIPRANFLKSCLSGFVDNKVLCVQCKPLFTNQDTLMRRAAAFMQTHYYQLFQKSRDRREMVFFGGSSGMFRSTLLKQIEGFNETTIVEDTDTSYIAITQGLKIRYVDDVVADALIPPTPQAIIEQLQRWHHGIAHVFNRRFTTICRYKGKLSIFFDLLNTSIAPIVVVFVWILNVGNLFIYYFGWDNNVRIIRSSEGSILFFVGFPLFIISNIGIIISLIAWIRDKQDPVPTIPKKGIWAGITTIFGFYFLYFTVQVYLIPSVLKGMFNIPKKYIQSTKIKKKKPQQNRINFKEIKGGITVFGLFFLSLAFYKPLPEMLHTQNPLGGWFLLFAIILTMPLIILMDEFFHRYRER